MQSDYFLLSTTYTTVYYTSYSNVVERNKLILIEMFILCGVYSWQNGPGKKYSLRSIRKFPKIPTFPNSIENHSSQELLSTSWSQSFIYASL